MQSLSLADELTLELGAAREGVGDEVVCPGLPGPAEENLAALALAAFREASGWRSPPGAPADRQADPAGGGAGGRVGRRRGDAAGWRPTPPGSGTRT